MTTTGTLAAEQENSPGPRRTRPPAAYRPTLLALRTELRRGIAPWTGGCVVLMLGVTMAAKADTWQGGWGEAQGYLHSAATLLTGPLVAAASCRQGARDHRRSTAGLWSTTPRARSTRVVVAALPIALWAVAGYLVVFAASLVATWPYAGGGSPFASVAVADCAFLLAVGPVGFVVGQRCRWRLAAPALAVVLYLVLGVPDYYDSSAQYLDPAMQYALERTLPVWWFAPAMAAWTCGLALAALIAHAARHRFLAVVPLAVAAAVAPLITHAGPDLLREDPAASRPVCADGTPRLCLTEYDESLLPQVSRALSGLFGRLDGVPGAPARYVDQEPLDGSTEVRVPTPYVGGYLLRGRLQHPEDFVWQVTYGVVNRECPDTLHTDRVMATDEAVRGWLAGPDAARYFGTERTPQLRRLEAMPASERRVWLGRFLATRTSCTPSEVPVL
ncbi:hypothetical protein [Streptomyces sp. NBC_00338]|uniref:hypothetical protein n=1 Tax=Streptomyces sp. NBC_00338 TaxID=2975715 RepID=UPI002250B732|nr:hypothetical protein [Streptomyces sp. NBC_00338]MCX5142887.1 hypothetical protein [Streptomyces sp. NBC_00338]